MPSWPKPGTKAHDALKTLAEHGSLTEHDIWFHNRARGGGLFYGELRILINSCYVAAHRPAGKLVYTITDAGRAVLEGDQDA
jgi:hypothetical protein